MGFIGNTLKWALWIFFVWGFGTLGLGYILLRIYGEPETASIEPYVIWWFHTMWIVPLFGGVCAALGIAGKNSKERAENLRKEKQQVDQKNELERQDAARRRQEGISTLEATMRESCVAAVQEFELLPNDLANAKSWLPEARSHFSNNAYSPFWQAVESAYSCLGVYNNRITVIERQYAAYRQAAGQLIRQDGRSLTTPFPVKLAAVEAIQSSKGIVAALETLVYEAQRNPVFAQIWEQRRTTGAVIAGFANLEAAVSRMATTIDWSISSLAESVGGMHKDLSVAASNSVSLSAEQLRAQTALNKRVDQACIELAARR